MTHITHQEITNVLSDIANVFLDTDPKMKDLPSILLELQIAEIIVSWFDDKPAVLATLYDRKLHVSPEALNP